MTSQEPVEGGLAEPEELEPAPGTLALTLEGPAATRADWEQAAAAVLRKAGRLGEHADDAEVWDRLALTTLDGIAISPLGTPDLTADLKTSGRPTRVGPWDVRTRPRTNEEALDDLAHGATSLWVDADADADALPGLLEGVLLELAPVVLDGLHAAEAADALVGLARDRGVALHPQTNLGASALDDAAVHVARLAVEHDVRGVVVDATAVHDLGASDAQELGYALAAGSAYLRTAERAGLSVADALRVVEFRYAATDEQFPTIAKLRAARRLWARIAELCEEPLAGPQHQHVVTSRPMLSKYDPWVNLLRTTIAAFAAGVGGADAVTVLPFDVPLGVPDTFGRRIARNTSSLLVAESHVAAVTDPAGGAHAVEKLTDDLVSAGWAELQRIEEAGGLAAALADGSLHARIADVARRRDEQVARRTRPLTGLTEFPHLGETLPERQADPSDDVRRYGAAFEALRDDPVAEPVFLATMGAVAAHTARAMFATNLLAAGGIPVDTAEAHDGQRVVCVCGTDAAYAEGGADAAAALRAGGAEWVIVAGRPTDWSDDSCALGVDAVDFLTRTRARLV